MTVTYRVFGGPAGEMVHRDHVLKGQKGVIAAHFAGKPVQHKFNYGCHVGKSNPARKPAKDHPWKRPACEPTRRDIPGFEWLKKPARFDRGGRPR